MPKTAETVRRMLGRVHSHGPERGSRGWNAATTIIDSKLDDHRDAWYKCGWDDAMRVKAVEEAVQKLAPHEFAKSSQGKTTGNDEA